VVSPAVAALNEGTLAVATKVADIAVADDDGGFRNLTLVGADAAYFQIIGSELFLRAGAVIDFEVKNALSVQVAVDDPTVGGATDALSAVYTLTVGNLTPETLLGTDGNDVLNGNADGNLIFAGLGNDLLAGGPGFDLLVGGRGADIMSGGPGEDSYDFDSKKDSGKTAATRDKILDFEHSIDIFDITGHFRPVYFLVSFDAFL
jgi:Ca2+-binding RTX toxin-like protein